MEGGRKRMGKKVQGLRSTNWFMQDGQGEVKNSIGNGVAKELICMTHGHDLKGELPEGMGDTGWSGAKGKTVTGVIR